MHPQFLFLLWLFVDLLVTSFPTCGAVVAFVVVWIDVDGINFDASLYGEGFVDTTFFLGVLTVGDVIFGVNFGAKTRPLRVMSPVLDILTIYASENCID